MSLSFPPHLQAKVYLLTHKEGGWDYPCFSPYSCQFRPYTSDISNSIFIENINPENPMLAQGKEILCNILFGYGIKDYHIGKFHEGFHFKLQIANRIIGEACVTKVFAEELYYWHAETLLAEFKQKQLQDVSNSFRHQLCKLHSELKTTIPLFENSYFPAHLKLPKDTYLMITYEGLAALSLGQHRLKCTYRYALNGKKYALYDIATWNDKSYALCQVYSEKTVAYGI